MTDRPILFSGPMIRALLEGRKTQTRRVFKGIEADGNGTFHVFNRHGGLIRVSEADVPTEAPDYVPYAVGDRLWVREGWRTLGCHDHRPPSQIEAGEAIHYEVDGQAPQWAPRSLGGRRRPSMFMPRWASRLTLIVTDVRVQRLQEISEADAKEEGAGSHPCGGCGEKNPDGRCIGCLHPFHTNGFQVLWDSLNAKPRPRYGDDGKVTHYESFPWGGESVTETYRGKPHHIHANPWVAALTFEVIRQNIDAMGEAA